MTLETSVLCSGNFHPYRVVKMIVVSAHNDIEFCCFYLWLQQAVNTKYSVKLKPLWGIFNSVREIERVNFYFNYVGWLPFPFQFVLALTHYPPNTHTPSLPFPLPLSLTGSEGPYDPLHGSSNEDSGGSLPLTPPTSDSLPCSSGSLDRLANTDDADQPARKKRHPIPEEKKDAKYWERRRKNNVAAKRSREMRRKKTEEELKTAREAIQENQKLRQEVEVLKAEINSLRRLLKDANMTLSLWIRARQTSEPSAQLPPMLRGQNVSFVSSFPVSSSVWIRLYTSKQFIPF